MKLTFLGATETVTGSKYFVEYNRSKFLVDCGLFQGFKDLRLRNWQDLPININELDAVILTHAHIDHSGYVPKLIQKGFKGKIYCTSATRDLCNILLPDCGHLMEEDARYANKKGFSKHKPALPLFTVEDAKNSLQYFRPIPYDAPFDLGDGLSVEFKNAGHILGSAHVILRDQYKTITFSGDIGRPIDPILNPPNPPKKTDVLVMESTYGNRLHSTSDPLDEIANVINRTIDRSGTIIIPAFALGRSQTILYDLFKLKQAKRISGIPIYLNSPMAINVTDVYCKHQEQHRLTEDECKKMCSTATYVRSVEESKELNTNQEPKVIISASGMATGGRVLHHLKMFAPDPKNTILFSGFQAGGTRGRQMIEGAKVIKIHGQMIPLRAEVCQLDQLSAHADAHELIAWASQITAAPSQTFITHGEPSASIEFKATMEKQLNWKCKTPHYQNEVEL